MLPDGIAEHLFGLAYLHAYLGQVGKLEGRTILVYQCFDVHPVELEIVIIIYIKTLLGEMERLRDEIVVCVVHLLIDAAKESQR